MVQFYNEITLISTSKVICLDGFYTTTGVSDGILAILQNTTNDSAVGIYGNLTEFGEIITGSDRYEIIHEFVSINEKGELRSTWGSDKPASFFTELYVGMLDDDFDDFEFETGASVQITDAQNELQLDRYVDCLGLTKSTLTDGIFQFHFDSNQLFYADNQIKDLGELFDYLQTEGVVKIAVVQLVNN